MTPTEVIARLAMWEQDEGGLVNLPESSEVEFKTVYRLQTPRQKAEFAKDIASLANAGGGLIVVGVETRPDDQLGRDVSVRVRPLAPGTLSLAQIEDVARSWVYPPQRSLRVTEWPRSDGQMLVSIEVPSLSDTGAMALVLGPGEEPDRRTVGVPVRSDARVDFHLAPELYEWIRRGRLQSSLISRAPELEEPPGDADRYLERLRAEFDVEGSNRGAVLFLQAWPRPSCRLERMHDRDGVRGVFLDPPPHRPASFGWWGLHPELDAGGGLRISGGDRVLLWISTAGVVTVAIAQEYLCWAMDRYAYGRNEPLINPTTLGELVYEFCRTFLAVISHCEGPARAAAFRVGLLNARDPIPLALGPGLPDYGFSIEARAAPDDEIVESLDVELEADPRDAERLTARLLQAIYARFGLGRDAIPYLSEDGSRFDPLGLKQ